MKLLLLKWLINNTCLFMITIIIIFESLYIINKKETKPLSKKLYISIITNSFITWSSVQTVFSIPNSKIIINSLHLLLNFQSCLHIGHCCWGCECNHFTIQCMWKQWEHAPQTKGHSSPGNLQSGQQLSKGIRQMPQLSSFAIHLQVATPVQPMKFYINRYEILICQKNLRSSRIKTRKNEWSQKAGRAWNFYLLLIVTFIALSEHVANSNDNKIQIRNNNRF